MREAINNLIQQRLEVADDILRGDDKFAQYNEKVEELITEVGKLPGGEALMDEIKTFAEYKYISVEEVMFKQGFLNGIKASQLVQNEIDTI